MQITLNIKDEKELLSELRDVLKGQILQIAREEAATLFNTELLRALEHKVQNISDYTMKDHIRGTLDQAINKTLGGGWYNQAYVKEKADDLIEQRTRSELLGIKYEQKAEKAITDAVNSIKNDLIKKLMTV